ncbi:helix-turn-helix domain-containing protein [Sphingobium sp. B11D3A]|uniref:AlbA family DNA-binding domain-containing protein n=1 Tax=Sphingobium sp. B11D3A TaxID=2940574 RepID=UPI0022250F08|nr:ATP-binding protein [Sphingobium sp. B11D3A]MCW2393523.1 hypothetical protein [Sphingobium sp. B11D3A]
MIERALADITEADLQGLVERATPENRRLDFKAQLPGRSSREVKNFLIDVASFANGEGGDLIYGLVEDGNGAAYALPGVGPEGLDESLLAFEQRVRDCLDPRLPTFDIHRVPLASGQVAIVVRVPPSMLAPHRVRYEGHSYFYGRHSGGNFEMDAADLRFAFAANESISIRLRDLHKRAVQRLDGENMPCAMHPGPKFVLTIAPLSLGRERGDFPITQHNAMLPYDPDRRPPVVRTGLEGVIIYIPADENPQSASAWSISHRAGYLEHVWSLGRIHETAGAVIFRSRIEEAVANMAAHSMTHLRELGLDGPFVALATMTGIRDYKIWIRADWPTDEAWQDPAYLGEVIADRLDPDSVRPLLEASWRVFGENDVPPAGR